MNKELIPKKSISYPEVVDEEGNKIIGPEMEAVVGLVSQMAQVAQLARIRKSLEREHFEGKMDARTLSTTDEVKAVELVNDWPYTPWVTATFFNDGNPALPSGTNIPVYIGLNSMNPFATLNTGDQLPVDFTKADKRIKIIYYWCDAGNTAVVRAVGKY